MILLCLLWSVLLSTTSACAVVSALKCYNIHKLGQSSTESIAPQQVDDDRQMIRQRRVLDVDASNPPRGARNVHKVNNGARPVRHRRRYSPTKVLL